jgi:hypothetical protein
MTGREYSRFPTFLQDRSEVQTAAVREMLENGTHATLRNRRPPQDQRVLRRARPATDTLLAPVLVEAIVDGRHFSATSPWHSSS